MITELPAEANSHHAAATHCPYCAFQCGMHLGGTPGGTVDRRQRGFPRQQGRPLHQGLDFRRGVGAGVSRYPRTLLSKRRGDIRRRVADQRKELPAWQVRPGRAANPQHRPQRCGRLRLRQPERRMRRRQSRFLNLNRRRTTTLPALRQEFCATSSSSTSCRNHHGGPG